MLETEKVTECAHCGTPFTARAAEKYCCHGCDYVAQLLTENKLTRFYELKGNTSLPPVGSKAFRKVETDLLEALASSVEASATSNIAHSKFSIEGISCIGCVWLIEAIFKRQEGAATIRIDPRSSSIELAWQIKHFDISAFAEALQQIGYQLSPYSEDPESHKQSKQLIQRIGLCGFFLMNTMLFTLPSYLGMRSDFFIAPLFQLLGAGFATLSLFIGGGYFIQRAYQAARNRTLHIDLPIAAGLLAGYFGSLIGWATNYTQLIYFDFVATFVFLMLVGRWLQEYALEKNRSHLQRQTVGPRNVTLIGGAEDGESIPVNRLIKEQAYSISPGGINPVAADLLEKEASLSLEWINGEAEPITWAQQCILPAGAINVGMHPVRARARESWEDSLLFKLLERPEDSFRAQRLQTVLKYYIASVMLIAVSGALAWFVVTGNGLKTMQVLISILIVSCPCALGVALPMCDELASTRLRKIGLFIKNAQIWERISRIKTVVFDKTGTLTMDIPRIRNQEEVNSLDPLSAYALFQLVCNNSHPIARSLRESLLTAFPHLHEVRSDATGIIEESIGNGVLWHDAGGSEWTLGKSKWKRAGDNDTNRQSALRQDGLLVASFDFCEDVRDDSLNTVKQLANLKLKTAILSGDSAERVERIRVQLELPEATTRSSCTPQDKAQWIEEHAADQALMIGDGANDSLAFDTAVCRGTPVVDRSILEASADFFFFGRSLRCIPTLFQVAKKRRRMVALIFAVAVTYNIIAISICLAGKMHPLLAAILMPLSSLVTLGIAWVGMRDS